MRLQLWFTPDQPDTIMAPTKVQKTVKSTETDDDGGITFKKKQDDLRKSVSQPNVPRTRQNARISKAIDQSRRSVHITNRDYLDRSWSVRKRRVQEFARIAATSRRTCKRELNPSSATSRSSSKWSFVIRMNMDHGQCMSACISNMEIRETHLSHPSARFGNSCLLARRAHRTPLRRGKAKRLNSAI